MKIQDKEKLLNNKTFCILPWMSAYVNTDSTVWSCCVNKTMTQGDHGVEETDIMNQPIQDIINSDYFKKLRLDMLNGVKNTNCSDCYILEATSGHSYRDDFNKEYDEYFDNVYKTNEDGSIDDFETIYLDFRFSNLCNFKCRSCRPEWSSTWAKESINAEDHPYHYWEDTGKYNLKKYELDKKEFIEKFKNEFGSVKRIYFAGGEPLAAKEQYWILEYLIESNKTDVFIEYNTNLSMLKNDKLKLNITDYWKQFSNVNLRISLDGMGDRAEYLRSGTDWELIENNFKYLKENLPNIYLGISSVFQLNNALHLPDFFQYWIDIGLLDGDGLHHTFIIPLVGPDQLSSQILPKEIKEKVEKRWDEFMKKNLKSNHDNFKGYVKNCIDYMNGQDLYESGKSSFINFTTYLDTIRNESFNEVFPELSNYFEVTNISHPKQTDRFSDWVELNINNE